MTSVLERPVSIDRASVPFGNLTLAQVQSRAGQLRESVGWGPTAKVAPVARAWEELAKRMEDAHADTVAALGTTAEDMAQALWVVPPGGSLL